MRLCTCDGRPRFVRVAGYRSRAFGPLCADRGKRQFGRAVLGDLDTSKDLWHYTFGGGFAISRRLEVNGAADLSGRSRSVSLSAVVRY